jgi:hypothetical protein
MYIGSKKRSFRKKSVSAKGKKSQDEKNSAFAHTTRGPKNHLMAIVGGFPRRRSPFEKR